MKCAVCGKEFGNGDNCQYCGTDRVSGLGKYDGYTPKNSSTNNDKQVSAPRTKKQPANTTGYTLCYKCAEPIPEGSVYCPKCGTKLIVECPKCGHTYSSQYPICNQCGTDREKYIAEQKRLAELRAAEEKRRQEEAERAKAEQARLARLAEEARMAEEHRKQEAERLKLEEQRRLEAEAEKARKAKEREKKRQERLEKEKSKQEELAIMDTECYKEAYAYLYNMYDKFIKAKVRNIHCYANFPLGLLCFLVTLLVMSLVYCYNLFLFVCIVAFSGVILVGLIAQNKILTRIPKSWYGIVCGIDIYLFILGIVPIIFNFCAPGMAQWQETLPDRLTGISSLSWWTDNWQWGLGLVVECFIITIVIIILMLMVVLKKRPLYKMDNEIIDKWINKYFNKHDIFKCTQSRKIVMGVIVDYKYKSIPLYYQYMPLSEIIARNVEIPEEEPHPLFRRHDRNVSLEDKIKELVISEYKKFV